MREGFARWEIFSFILMFAAIVFSVLAAWGISRSIYIPIKKLHDVTTTITKNDLQALVTSDNVDEITELGMSFNIMIGKIRELLDSKIKEQENLKKAELRALQAQINPHFLYNTLDTIIWMAEAKKTDQVIEIVSALSSFFRISLSKGKDWITIGEEIERTRSYLTIQKMRYRDILDFKIEVDEAVARQHDPEADPPAAGGKCALSRHQEQTPGRHDHRARQATRLKTKFCLKWKMMGLASLPRSWPSSRPSWRMILATSSWKAALALAMSTNASGCIMENSMVFRSKANTTPAPV